MKHQSKQLHPHAAERLIHAVGNQAIFGVLEDGEEAKGAEQWLLSKEFDKLEDLLS